MTTNTNTNTARKLTMRGILTREAYKTLTAAERRALLKGEQAAEYSGLRAYPTTCARVMDRIPDECADPEVRRAAAAHHRQRRPAPRRALHTGIPQ